MIIFGHVTTSVVIVLQFNGREYKNRTTQISIRKDGNFKKFDGVNLLKAHKSIKNTYYCIANKHIIKFSLDIDNESAIHDSIFHDYSGIVDYSLLDDIYIGVLTISNKFHIFD